MICHILFVLSPLPGHVTEVFMTVGKGCQMGNKIFLSHPVLCPVVICREFEAVGSCSSEITLSCLLSGISHETEKFCSGCFISPSAHPPPYLMRLMSCHPICHPNTKFQKTDTRKFGMQMQFIDVFFISLWHLRLLTFPPDCVYTVPLKCTFL